MAGGASDIQLAGRGFDGHRILGLDGISKLQRLFAHVLGPLDPLGGVFVPGLYLDVTLVRDSLGDGCGYINRGLKGRPLLDQLRLVMDVLARA